MSTPPAPPHPVPADDEPRRPRVLAACAVLAAVGLAAVLAVGFLVYAAVEAVVALVAFGFHLMFVAASGWALDSLLPAVCEGQGWCWANWFLAAALILALTVEALAERARRLRGWAETPPSKHSHYDR